MKLLITGGAGFIGGNFIHHLVDKGSHHEIICLDQLTYAGNLSTLKTLIDDGKIRFVQADIADSKKMDEIFNQERFDVVVNFAAESHVDRSIENPGVFLKTNIMGVNVLLNMCKKYEVGRFHQISTDEVYGEFSYDHHDKMFDEKCALNPTSPYAASKASADMLVLAYYKTYKLPVTISRSSNNYGPYHFPEKLIPLMITNAMEGRPLPVYGDGDNIRNWLHVSDHCEAIELIINKGKLGEIYNVGSDEERSNKEVVESILAELGKPIDLIQYVEDRPGHDFRYGIDSSKLIQELGWDQKIHFDEGLRNTIDWYQGNKKWWKDIVER